MGMSEYKRVYNRVYYSLPRLYREMRSARRFGGEARWRGLPRARRPGGGCRACWRMPCAPLWSARSPSGLGSRGGAEEGEGGGAEEALVRARLLQRAVTVTPAKANQDGDYTDTTAFKLARHVGLPPAEVAALLAGSMERELLQSGGDGGDGGDGDILDKGNECPLLGSAIATERGFINISVNDRWLRERIAAYVSPSLSLPPSPGPSDPTVSPSPSFYNVLQKQGAVVDFASPNVGKQLHAGHLRSSVIGDSIARLLERQGHEVIRVSHVGDLGLPVALLIAHGLELGLCWLQDSEADLPTIEELGKLYINAKQRYASQKEQCSVFRAVVLSTLSALQGHKHQTIAFEPGACTYDAALVHTAWQRIRMWSLNRSIFMRG